MEADIIIRNTLMITRMALLVTQALFEFFQLIIFDSFRCKPRSLTLNCQSCLENHEKIFQYITIDQIIETLLILLEFETGVSCLNDASSQRCNRSPFKAVFLHISHNLKLIEFTSYGGTTDLDTSIGEFVHNVPGTHRILSFIDYFQNCLLPLILRNIQYLPPITLSSFQAVSPITY